jgi:hypothetical protein
VGPSASVLFRRVKLCSLGHVLSGWYSNGIVAQRSDLSTPKIQGIQARTGKQVDYDAFFLMALSAFASDSWLLRYSG